MGVSNTGTIAATIADSISAGNGQGLFVASAKPAVTATVVRSVVANNAGEAFVASGTGARVAIGRSTVTGNATTAVTQLGGVLQSFGDNHIAGNRDGDPALPVIARK